MTSFPDQGWQEYLLTVLGRIIGRPVEKAGDLYGQTEPERRNRGYWP